MDYEKKYKEALSRARSIIEDYKNRRLNDILSYAQEDLSAIFPELEMSADERIRKAMIDFFKHEREEGIVVLHYGVNIESMIAWLERQVDQKPAAWSEEDEMMIKFALTHFRKAGATEDSDIIKWLKSLKDRVQPQPKQEWSNWDRTIIGSIEALCDEKIESVVFQDVKEYVNDIKDWLKSLKERVQPQPKQEWSEEDEQTFIKSVEALEDFGKFELADWLKEHKNQSLRPQNT